MSRRKNFFADARPEDELARQQDVAALIAPRRLVAQDVSVERIEPNPFQARRSFGGLEELVKAIQAQGFTSRLRVRPHPAQPNYFQLVYGERRLRAAKQAGLLDVPVEIAEHTDDELVEIGLAENIQRRDLDPLEEAQAFRTLIDGRGYTIVRLAERLGKDRSYVESRLALLRTPADVQAMVAQRPDTIRAAREISKLPTPSARRTLIDAVLEGKLSKEDVRAIVRQAGMPPVAAAGDGLNSPLDGAAGHGPVRDAALNDRQLERDARIMASLLEKWEASLSGLSFIQRRRMIAYLREQQTQLDRVLESLQQHEP